MSIFTTDRDRERADWPLLQNGAVNLFHDQATLDQTKQALRALDYEIREISSRQGLAAFREQFSQALHWEEQFGYVPWSGHLDAFDDALFTFPFGPTARTALVLDGYNLLAAEVPRDAHLILDMLESSARGHLLWGKVLVVLVQTDDPDFQSGAIGGRRATWQPWPR